MKGKMIIIALLIFVAVWIGFIFLMSSQTAVESGKISYKVTKAAVILGEKTGVLNNGASNSNRMLNEYNIVVRKIAHVFMYFLLASVMFLTLWEFKLSKKLTVMFSFLLCIFIAFTDEINQMGFKGRNSGIISEGIKDLSKDTVGIMMALIILLIIRMIFEVKNKNVQ